MKKYPAKANLSRRNFCLTSAMGIFGLHSLTALKGTNPKRPANSCIFIWLSGGLSHLDSFDPKENTSSSTGSVFKPIQTSVKDIQIAQPLPRIAEMIEKTTLIRSLYSGETNHDRAAYHMLTGMQPSAMPRMIPFGALLTQNYNPKEIPNCLTIPNLVDINNNKLKSAMNLNGSKRLIKMYGNTPLGKGCLTARRCIETGVRFVTVVDEGWDHHEYIYSQLNQKLPFLDKAYAALLNDLIQRGLFKETLVVLLSEFGRSPFLNATGGRDHWPDAGCALLAGGPLAEGQLVGETDRNGSKPVKSKMSFPEFIHTIYTAMGIYEKEER